MKDLNLGMFKLYDIRTKMDKLTPELLERLSLSVALYYRNTLSAPSVVIGRDARLNAPSVTDSLVKALRSVGVDVLLNPLPISTCQFYYTCMQHRESGGIMVTASHNPGCYIGLKLMAQDVFPLAYGCGKEGGIEKIKEIYLSEPSFSSSEKKGKLHIINYLDDYISYSMALAGVKEGDLKGQKILLEFLNGSAGTEVAMAFQRAGAEVETMDIIPDGFFPKGDPNPIIESSIAPTRLAIKNGDYDYGFCFDGDGDRLDLMYKDGTQIVPGLNMALIAESVMKIFNGEKKDFYADVKAIPTSLALMAKNGARIHIIRNGHSFIKAKLRENCDKGYFASEEESAHYYMNFPYDLNDRSKGYASVENTLFFALMTAKCYKEKPEEYEKAYKLGQSIFREREWPLHFNKAPEKMEDIMKEVEDRMKELGAVVIKEMDDGDSLDATLMRFNLPITIDANTNLDGQIWCQVAERISRSEDAMCRWEVVSNSQKECERLNGEVRKITDRYVEEGYAFY